MSNLNLGNQIALPTIHDYYNETIFNRLLGFNQCIYDGGLTRQGNMLTFLKTAYVHFRLPSLVERAHIPRESISARLPVSPLHPCLPQSLIDHLSFSCSLFPPVHGFTPSLILSHGCCTFFGTVHCVPPLVQSGVE